MAKNQGEPQQEVNTDEDRYPSLRKLLHAIANLEDLPEGPVDHVEIRSLASGEAVYKVFPAREQEPVAGYLSAADLA